MKKAIACLVLGIVSGCGRSPVPVFTAHRVDDSKAHELAFPIWGKIEYAPRQYAGFVYDSTGVYFNLNGYNAPEAVEVWFTVKGSHAVSYPVLLSELNLWFKGVSPRDPTSRPATPPFNTVPYEPISGPLNAADPGWYGVTFKIPWKAFGVEGPPPEGVEASFHALTRKGRGARLVAPGSSVRAP